MTGFQIIPGDPDSAVVLHAPHASRTIPAGIRSGIVLDDHALEAELDAMTDGFTDVIAERAAAGAVVRPWIFVNRLSRLVIDPERFPDDREEMTSVGMGAVYTRTADGEPLRDHDQSLIHRFFEPYAEAFTELVDTRVAEVGGATILDLHSYPLDKLPYELHGDGPRPEVCLGTDVFHTGENLRDLAAEVFADFTVGLDSPFAGTYVPQRHWRTDARVEPLMIELRRDLYLDDDHVLIEPALAPVVAGLVSVVDGLRHRAGNIQ